MKACPATILSVDRLNVTFATPDGPVHAVQDLDFNVATGETLGIVGESGSGKSQTVLALLGLLAANGVAAGRALFDGKDLLALPEAHLRTIRGAQIAMIFQDPMTSLNPYLTIGRQMSTVLRQHQGMDRRAAWRECEALLDAVQITAARRRLGMYPHELSGGMRQRVMIATALLCKPALLIADEPTTALDVTVQAQILDLMHELRSEFSTSVILITHDLGVVAGSCDRVLVMHEGMQEEAGSTADVFYRSRNDYTRSLLDAVPRLDGEHADPTRKAPTNDGEPVLSAKGVSVEFSVSGGRLFVAPQVLRAVDDINIEVRPGETVGIVGESGCGKSTLARAMLRLVDSCGGSTCLLNRDLSALDGEELRTARRDMQMIFQDPLASLNPRMTIGRIVMEPLETFYPQLDPADRTRRVADMLTRVGLDASCVNRYPHEFSGGQCQRIGIARALISQPRLLICDEVVSALDVTVQAQIIRLLIDLQQQLDLAIVFIAHDLAVVRRISHRVIVMYLGKAVEIAATDKLFFQPRHPYTRALIAAAPVPDPEVERRRQHVAVRGEVSGQLESPAGCGFQSRCPNAVAECEQRPPAMALHGETWVACHQP
ncbi:MAG TPA: ABC transporter ATP-binding protein [Gammaproteobacteria bacterium]|jgi:oligopeptide/dipeptide ABC transporter ATP-binding protein|nr:ABC transporter ATP-binding protein [Chromatiales bacterium]MDP7661102.1 ABC transporter ATP-binding protein [Gammaproteobacteria bacterium]HJP38165.1 ABC transporter ATP-binding protein [Gammaproteobacteria bacterium]